MSDLLQQYPFDTRILRTDEPVVYFPVRHHSPAGARLVREVADVIRPRAVLIEGPSDYNHEIGDLLLPHRLPIAIYSYVRMEDDTRRGAFYPFCAYSPEWQAVREANLLNVPARFIDLPWAEMALGSRRVNRFADEERASHYLARLAVKLGLDDFDTVWDTMFEIDPKLSVEDYFERCHTLWHLARLCDGEVDEETARRERFMAQRIAEAEREFGLPLLVVTGAYHSYALFAQRTGVPFPMPEVKASDPEGPGVVERGIALTPYSYERLDALTGYDAGMPNPGFYDRVWTDREHGKSTASWRFLVTRVVKALRERKQTVSTADLIAVETMARGLATLRGHAEVWRQDLVDGVLSALLKDESAAGHPFMQEVHRALRGDARGALAQGTKLPPLVEDIRRILHEHELEPAQLERAVPLDLYEPQDRVRSQVLHQLRCLGIAGFQLAQGADFVKREDMTHLREYWALRWSPQFDANCIEAAVYGASLGEAAGAKLGEQARQLERDAGKAALLLLEASLMGLPRWVDDFSDRVTALLREDGRFESVTAAVGHLLHLYRYDDVLGTKGQAKIGHLLTEAFARGMFLLESGAGGDADSLNGLQTLRDTVLHADAGLMLDRQGFRLTLRRVADNPRQPAQLRGGATGVLWSLNTGDHGVRTDLPETTEPEQLGDFLTGLFKLAREVVQRHPALLEEVDRLVQAFDEEAFLAALPPLRLAFSFFTPREKNYLARSLFPNEAGPSLVLKDSPVSAAAALAWEARLFETMRRFGLRAAEPETEGSHV